MDNAKYHFSEPVKEFLKTSRVNPIFLPSYSPELNLIERLWKVLKKHVLNNKYYESFNDFKDACDRFFKNQGDHYDEIESIMGGGIISLL